MAFYDPELVKLIKNALKEVDRGLFFIADYEKQALNVLKTLEINGYRLLPLEPNQNMVTQGVKAVKVGTTESDKLVTEIYKNMVEA